jgi:hypothetical protein
MTLRRQMILHIAVPTLTIYVVILGITSYYAYGESKQAVQRSMTQLADSYAARFDGQLREVAQIADTTARSIETVGTLPDEKLYQLLEHDVRQSPLVYGACMAFEPGAIKSSELLFAPYVCRDEETLRRINIDRAVYDWYSDPMYTWFSSPKTLGRAVWSKPYFDKGAGNILMATYSSPFQLDKKFGGGGGFNEELDFVILAKDGEFIYDPDT